MYQKGSLRGGNNININLIMSEGKIVIPSIIQICVLHWYHMYLIHPVMDRMEAVILQHLYWPVIINSIRKKVTNSDTFQHTKQSNI